MASRWTLGHVPSTFSRGKIASRLGGRERLFLSVCYLFISTLHEIRLRKLLLLQRVERLTTDRQTGALAPILSRRRRDLPIADELPRSAWRSQCSLNEARVIQFKSKQRS